MYIQKCITVITNISQYEKCVKCIIESELNTLFIK